MPAVPETRNQSSSIRRALAALNFIAEYPDFPPGPGLQEISAGLALPKSTLLRVLSPLIDEGLIKHNPQTARYSLAPKIAYFSGLYLNRLDLRAVAQPILRGLSDRTGESVHLVVPDGLGVVYIDKAESRNPIRMFAGIGSRQEMYCTAVGKALLSNLPDTTISAVLEAGMVARTKNTITDEVQFRKELAKIKAQGFAVDDVENELGIRCVGAAIFDHTGTPIAALSVSGPDTRVTSELIPELGQLVGESARKISRRLGAGAVSPT